MTRLDVPGFQETLGAAMCGPASLKIVLDYFGVHKSEQEIAGLASKTDLGTDDAGLARAAESLGLRAVIKNESSFDDIEQWLQKGVPVIVDWFTRGRSDYSDSDIADGHYSVVCGLDDDTVYLQDPEIGGLRAIPRKEFLKVWFDFSGETIKPDELIIRQMIAIYPE